MIFGNRALKLGLSRQLESDIQTAIVNGYDVGDDEAKIRLLTASKTKIPANLRHFWQLVHGTELPSNPQEILADKYVATLFEQPKNQKRLRPYEINRLTPRG